MPNDIPTKNISVVKCLAEKFDVDQFIMVRMMNYPDVDVTCEDCGGTHKSDEYVVGFYRGHAIRHGSRCDVIEYQFPVSCPYCGKESKFAYFFCDDSEKEWNAFFGLTEDGKIIKDAG